MAVEPFADQALRDTTRRRFISERDLGLDDGVQSGVQLFIRQANAGAAVIALLLIQLQPLFRVGRFKGIVTLHRSSPRCEACDRGDIAQVIELEIIIERRVPGIV
jgi:hypothetical protein